MGRPSKNPETLRQVVTLRLDPPVLRKLEMASKKAGTRFSKDLEARLIATCDLDREGVELVRTIAVEIAQIQKLTGKRWHKDLKTWASVLEMLAEGPIHNFDPDRPQDDEFVEAAFDKLEALESARTELLDQLADLGIAARHNPDKAVGGIGSLSDPTRSSTRLMCERLDSEQQTIALALLDDIIQIDDQVRKADAEFKATLRPHYEQTMAGRQLYRNYLQKEAERKRSLGEPYDIMHLRGLTT
jgi:hypothetical protein